MANAATTGSWQVAPTRTSARRHSARPSLLAPPCPRQLRSGLLGGGRTVGARPLRQLQDVQQSSRRHVMVYAGRWNGGGSPDIPERVLSSLPYLLPLFDGLRFGKFAFMQFPAVGALLSPLDPLMRLYFSIPFASLVCFFAVYLGIVNNTSWSRFVRYNAMQAILLDVILILPSVLESVFRPSGFGSVGLQITITLYNTIFLFLLTCVAYGVGSCLLGKSARLPLVGDAADAQIR